MEDIIIDANVIVGYYKEDVLGLNPGAQNITGSTLRIFQSIRDCQASILMDDGAGQEGKIENEWKRNIPKAGKEWFDSWYYSLLQSGMIRLILLDQATAQQLLHELYKRGFPQEGGDKWYIRTATTVIDQKCRAEEQEAYVNLVSEDIDFFAPTRKHQAKGAERLNCLLKREDEVQDLLWDNGIRLYCIENYNQRE
jgi:hypothetical protein